MTAEGWVLAGGQSRRMGQDKANLAIDGVSMLARILEKMAKMRLTPRVAGLRTPQASIGVEVIPDAHPECGPLSGIETALHRTDADAALVVSVDMPLVSTAFLTWMLERASATGALATVPRVLGEAQPLCAVYRRELAEPVSRALNAGEFKVMRAIERGVVELGAQVDSFDVERMAATGGWKDDRPMHWQLLNCNTPEDVALAKALLAGRFCKCV